MMMWPAWSILAVIVVVRIVTAMLIPDLDGDAGAYVKATARLRDALRDGTLGLATLFGFWPPGYQLISAVVALVLPSAEQGCRLVSFVAGLVSCAMLWRITLRLTGSVPLAWVAAVVTGLMPLHVAYSSTAMTEVPTTALVLISLDAALAQRWTWSAAFLIPAGLIRVETWPLAFALPVMAALHERRFVWAPAALAPLAPALWLLICARATGNPWEYFAVRNRYVVGYLARHPERRGFEMAFAGDDVLNLLLGATPAVLLLVFWVVGTIGWQAVHGGRRLDARGQLMITLVYFCVPLTFLGLAWVTRNQPLIAIRYGLPYMSLGLPIALWAIEHWAREWRRIALATFLLLTFGTAVIQLIWMRDHIHYRQTRRLRAEGPATLSVSAVAATTAPRSALHRHSSTEAVFW